MEYVLFRLKTLGSVPSTHESSAEMWFFARDEIPSDISSGSPDPDSWGMPTALFDVSRVPQDSFKKLRMIL